jgi:hypothetical protein
MVSAAALMLKMIINSSTLRGFMLQVLELLEVLKLKNQFQGLLKSS